MPTIIKPSRGDQIGYWLFVGFICAFMLYIMLIRPLLLPADKMPFIFSTNAHEQKVQYALWTGGAILAAIIATPILIWRIEKSLEPQNDLMEDITSASLTDQITHRQYMILINMLPLGKTKAWHVKAARELLDRYLAETQGNEKTA